MTEPAQPVTFAGPPVSTGVAFTPPGQVRLRIDGSNAPTALDGDLVAALFALGLQTREPDRSGWVILGELEVDDEISFLVGTTGIDRDAATEAVRRGVERALDEGVAHRRDRRPSATDPSEEP